MLKLFRQKIDWKVGLFFIFLFNTFGFSLTRFTFFLRIASVQREKDAFVQRMLKHTPLKIDIMTIHILTELPTLLPSATGSQPSNIIGNQQRDPVIRKQETNVDIHFTPALSNGLSNDKGDLYITESQLIWWSPLSNSGVAIDYPTIIIHAISRATDRVVQRPCIYAQLHAEDAIEGENEDDDEEDMIDTIEMRLVPENDRNRKCILLLFPPSISQL